LENPQHTSALFFLPLPSTLTLRLNSKFNIKTNFNFNIKTKLERKPNMKSQILLLVATALVPSTLADKPKLNQYRTVDDW